MKSSRNLKAGVTLLVIALAVGVFALVIWADGNEMYGTHGMRGRSGGDFETPRYGMQDKEFSNQVEGMGVGMGRKAAAPDHDNDGIPNGQDDDYVSECDDDCDGTCDSEAQGTGMRRNSPDNISGLQAHVSGMEMKTMAIADIAALWGIDGHSFLAEMIKEFNLQKEYITDNTIDDLRGEYRFSPYQIMEIAERIKATSVE
jgi:hypothetical protein